MRRTATLITKRWSSPSIQTGVHRSSLAANERNLLTDICLQAALGDELVDQAHPCAATNVLAGYI